MTLNQELSNLRNETLYKIDILNKENDELQSELDNLMYNYKTALSLEPWRDTGYEKDIDELQCRLAGIEDQLKSLDNELNNLDIV